MRTTLTINEDVAIKLKSMVRKTGQPFKQIVNQALQYGLQQLEQPPKAKPYRTKPHSFGLRPGLSYDKINDFLDQLDVEEYIQKRDGSA